MRRRRRKKLPPGTLRVQFEDEAPRIGNGHRLVTVELGRKWARVHDVATGVNAKLPLTMWARIARSAREVTP